MGLAQDMADMIRAHLPVRLGLPVRWCWGWEDYESPFDGHTLVLDYPVEPREPVAEITWSSGVYFFEFTYKPPLSLGAWQELACDLQDTILATCVGID